MSRTLRLSYVWIALWGTLSVAFLLKPVPMQLERMLDSASLSFGLNGILGYDAFGRDLLSLLLKASGFSLAFASLVTFLVVTSGLFLGSLMALTGSESRFILRRALDFIQAFPPLLIALVLVSLIGPGLKTLLIALVVGALPSFVRMIYLRSQELRFEPFVEAAQGLGGSPVWIVRKHFFPHLSSLAFLKAPHIYAAILLHEATLTFFGLGTRTGTESWGSLLVQSREYLLESPRLAIVTGGTLLLTVLALQRISQSFSETQKLRLYS